MKKKTIQYLIKKLRNYFIVIRLLKKLRNNSNNNVIISLKIYLNLYELTYKNYLKLIYILINYINFTFTVFLLKMIE